MRRLEGSCHCGAVRFSVMSHTPVPYMRCYCSICRKTAGGGGYAVNIMGEAGTLEVTGADHVTVYRARGAEDSDVGQGRRHFCNHCGSALYVTDPRWPELVHPFASAIDSSLPEAADRQHIMLDHKSSWVAVREGPNDAHFAVYPDRSIADWHKDHGLYEP